MPRNTRLAVIFMATGCLFAVLVGLLTWRFSTPNSAAEPTTPATPLATQLAAEPHGGLPEAHPHTLTEAAPNRTVRSHGRTTRGLDHDPLLPPNAYFPSSTPRLEATPTTTLLPSPLLESSAAAPSTRRLSHGGEDETSQLPLRPRPEATPAPTPAPTPSPTPAPGQSPQPQPTPTPSPSPDGPTPSTPPEGTSPTSEDTTSPVQPAPSAEGEPHPAEPEPHDPEQPPVADPTSTPGDTADLEPSPLPASR